MRIRHRAKDSMTGFVDFRPGASSGVLLGAVTLPALMLSKLTQMSRAVSLKEIEIEGKNSSLVDHVRLIWKM